MDGRCRQGGTGNYKQAMEQWIKEEQLKGHEARAKELRQIFERSGYKGYLRKDAKNREAEGDPYSAATDYALEKAFASHVRSGQQGRS